MNRLQGYTGRAFLNRRRLEKSSEVQEEVVNEVDAEPEPEAPEFQPQCVESTNFHDDDSETPEISIQGLQKDHSYQVNSSKPTKNSVSPKTGFKILLGEMNKMII